MAEKNIKLEAIVDDDLELAYDKAKNLINQKVPEEQKTEALQKIMDTLKNDPNSRDAFVANPEEFSAKVLGIEPSTEGKPTESMTPEEGNDPNPSDKAQGEETPEESATEDKQGNTPEGGNDEQGEDADIATPDEEDAAKETALDKLATIYPVMAKEYKLRFHDNPDDAEKLAKYTLKIVDGKGNNAVKWKQYIDERCSKGTNKAMIQNKVIPTLVKAYNAKGKDEIELTRQVNDDNVSDIQDRNGNKVGHIVIPEGFNQKPIEIGDQVVTMDFGYPAINFNSTLIKEILGETEKNRLKKLLTALMKRVEGTPAGKALIQNSLFSAKKRSSMLKLLKEAASARGIPMIRRPLKVDSSTLTGDSEADLIKVIPLNAVANPTTEAHSGIETDPLFEGWFSKNESEQHVYGKPVDLPAAYLKHFYTILVPSGTTGLHYYARYMSTSERTEMYDKLGQDAAEEIKSGNRNVNDMVLQRYLDKTNGVPPFYLLMPRTKPTKERLRVCDDTVINGMICIKSIEGKNKDAYFMDKDKIESVFEAG